MSERRQDFLARFDWIRTGLMGVAMGKKRRRSPPSGTSSCQSQAVYGQSWVSASRHGRRRIVRLVASVSQFARIR